MASRINSLNHFSTWKALNNSFLVIKIELDRAVIDHIDDFRDYVSSRIKGEKINLILDFSDAKIMDSSFLGTILFLMKRITSFGGSLSLVIDSEKIAVFSPLKNLIQLFQVYASVDDVINNSMS